MSRMSLLILSAFCPTYRTGGTLIECRLFERHRNKYFIYVIEFNPHDIFVRWVLLVIFYRSGHSLKERTEGALGRGQYS